MKRSIIIPISLVLVGLSALVSCTSCSQQPVNSKKGSEELRLLWSFAFTQPVVGISTVTLRPAITGDGSVITGLDRQYSSLSRTDGSLRWQRAVPDNMQESVKRLTIDDQYLYSKVHKDSAYFAIDLQSGGIAWQHTNPKGPFYDYVHDGLDENYLYLGGKDSVLYVFDKQKGFYVDTIHLQHYARAVVSDGQNLYISQAWKPDSSESAYGRIVSLDAQTHRRNWQYETTRGGFYYADLVLNNGALYAGTDGPGIFVALDAATGQVRWALEDYWCYRFTLGDGKIFINDSNYILAVDQRTGQVLWKDYFQGHTESNLAYLDGYLYHAHNGGLFVWDAQTGKLVAGPIKSPDRSGFYNLNAAGGKVFVQSDFHLYCYQAYKGE